VPCANYFECKVKQMGWELELRSTGFPYGRMADAKSVACFSCPFDLDRTVGSYESSPSGLWPMDKFRRLLALQLKLNYPTR
jgi:hypothetical protein